MARLDTNGYYALGVPLYVTVVALEVLLARRRGLQPYRFGDTLGNLAAGLGEVVIGLFIGPILLALYDFGYAHLALVHYRKDSPVSWVLAFLLADLCYYWYHRAGHNVAALWAIHGVHHQSEQFNVSVAMRHPWFSDFYSAVFYVPLPLLGIPPEQFFVAITLISFYALTVHSRVLHRPGLYFLVTPATHIVHHAQNARYLGKNLGAMFTLWDRLFGTHVEVDPADPPQLGTRVGYQTHDGARSQFLFFRDLGEAAQNARSWRERLRVYFGPPGYKPAGIALGPRQTARDDRAIPARVKAYVGLNFTLLSGLALYVLWLRDDHPRWLLICGSALVLQGLLTTGRLLDGGAGAARGEAGRLLGWALLGVALALTAGYAPVGAALLLTAALSAAWLRWISSAEPSPA